MTSTPTAANLVAISNFWSGFNDTPGVCSPSRSVVSKKRNFLANRLFGNEQVLSKSIFFTHPEVESDAELRPNTYNNLNNKIGEMNIRYFAQTKTAWFCHAWTLIAQGQIFFLHQNGAMFISNIKITNKGKREGMRSFLNVV